VDEEFLSRRSHGLTLLKNLGKRLMLPSRIYHPRGAKIEKHHPAKNVKQLMRQFNGDAIFSFKYNLLMVVYLPGWQGVVESRSHTVKNTDTRASWPFCRLGSSPGKQIRTFYGSAPQKVQRYPLQVECPDYQTGTALHL
jgi:hypothetical protein